MRAQRRKADPKNGKARFVRACAVETHMDMSQEAFCVEIHRKNAGPGSLQEAFCVDLYRKNAAHPFRDTSFVRACAVETQMDMLPRAILCGNLQEKCRTPFPGMAFCASLRNGNAHGHVTKSHFMRQFTRKSAGPRGEHLD